MGWTRRRLTLLEKFSLLSLFCIFGITVGVTASVAAFLSRQLVRHDAEVVGELINAMFIRNVPASYFGPSPTPDSSVYRETLTAITATAVTARVFLYDRSGTVLWSDDGSLIGRRFTENHELGAALRGEIQAHIIHPGKEEHQGSLRSFQRLVEIYVPVRYREGGPVVGVVEIYRHPPALFAALDRGRALVWLLGGGGFVLYVILFGIVRKSSGTQEALERQLATYARTLEERVAERTRELSQTARDIATLYELSSTINRSLDIHTILDSALEQLLRARGFDAGWVRFFSPPGPGFSLVACRGVSEEFTEYLRRKDYAGGKAEQAVRTGRPLLVYDEPGGGPYREGGSRREGLASIALLAIPLQERGLGTLNVACRRPYRFTPEDIQFLSSVTQQLGIAIGNAQLHAETLKREEEARILYDTTLRVGVQTDLGSLLTVIVEGAVKLTRASFGGVGFPEGDEIVMRGLFTRDSCAPPVVRPKISGSVIGLACASGQPQIVTDAARDPRVDQAAARAIGANTGIFAPLHIGGQVLGVLFACKQGGRPFTERDLMLLNTLAGHAAAAMENNRLHAETVKRERDASILYQTSTRLHGQTDLDALLATIVKGAIEITNATCGMIGQRVGDEIVMRTLVGIAPPAGVAEIRLPLAGSAAGLTYGTGEAIIVNDLAQSPCASPIREAAARYGLRSFLCAPLRSQATALGVIKVCNKKDGAPFTDDDLRLLTTFATEAAMAIENARLFHEIKTTKEYLENLIESSVDAIVTLSPRGRLTFVSQGGQRMFGYGEDQVLGTSVLAYWVKGRNDFRGFRKLLAEKGRIQNYETELSAANGRVVSVNISASLLYDARGRAVGVLAVVKDTTGLRQLYERMARAERLAAAGLLAAGVAHEVGNPLASISSLSQVLHARAVDPALQRGLRDIQTHVGRIHKIVRDLTQLARPAPFQFRESSLNEIVQDAVALARHNPATRKLRIAIAFDASLPRLHVAPDQLLQVFLNLILNAAEAGGDVTIQTVRDEGTARIAFADTGQGMSADELRRLFDPFYSIKDGETHLGLGLFVSHEIVRQHGGTIHAVSHPGAGSTFTVTLPLER